MSGPTMMQLVQRALRMWSTHMSRVTYSKVEVAGNEMEISITATWGETRAGAAGQHVVTFSRSTLLGHTASLPSTKQRVMHKMCWYRDQAVREILEARKGSG